MSASLPSLPSRVLVYGVTGSGKSTLASQIAQAAGRDWISVDDLTWKPGWVEVPDEVQRVLFAEIAARDEWILDTAYGKWVDVVLDRAQLVVALDYPRVLSLARLVRRTASRALTGEVCCGGNRESLRLAFSRDSIVAWHFKSWRRKRERIRRWEEELPSKVLRLTHPRQAREWLSSLGRERAPEAKTGPR